MKVKDLCDVLMDNASITIVKDRGCCIAVDTMQTNELRWSKYREREVELIKALSYRIDHFTIKLEEE